jgi:hypothetical protein
MLARDQQYTPVWVTESLMRAGWPPHREPV